MIIEVSCALTVAGSAVASWVDYRKEMRRELSYHLHAVINNAILMHSFTFGICMPCKTKSIIDHFCIFVLYIPVK